MLPAWCDDNGLPKSYLHFIFGMQYVTRHQARTAITIASSSGVYKMEKNARDEWWQLQRDAARE